MSLNLCVMLCKLGFVGVFTERSNCNASVGGDEIPLLGEMSRSDKGVMA